MIIFDLETDGLLPEVSKVHTLTTYSTITHEFNTFDKEFARAGIQFVMDAAEICGHNIIAYDLPVIKKLFGWEPKGKVRDTIILSRLAYPEIKDVDYGLNREGKLPGNLIGRHSLEAWGYRLGQRKGTFGKTTNWKEWSQEMSDYCKQDVKVTAELFNRVRAKGLPEEAIELEHQVQTIIYRQQVYGFLFDREKAETLYATLLKKQHEIGKKLSTFFKPWYVKGVSFTPKRSDKKKGYVAGVEFTKVKYTEFNPASRAHIADRLATLYGWKPAEYTEDGTPKLDEEILKALPYPEAPYLAEYFLLLKRIGQIAEGKEGWLKTVEKDGRIHGSVNTIGAVTRRMSHAHPNVAQVPRVGSPYGADCRGLFTSPKGRVLVGADASGLELRCLAHYMAAYDGGAYVQEILKGDIHTTNQKAAGLPDRDSAKTFIYAFLYGAGDYKIGIILNAGAAEGKAIKAKFLQSLPALATLKNVVESVAKDKGTLRSLDGAPMKVRSQHSALNTLLQGAGAIIMKKALVILDANLQGVYNFIPGKDYEFVANIHDEWQIECKENLAEIIGKMAAESFKWAGEALKLRCPLAGEYKVGKTWADTH